MNNTEIQLIEALKNALLTLKATGEDGFEGLIAVTLGAITSTPFRLASSGLQFGVDGKTSFSNDAICFEAKRYDQNLKRKDVIIKIYDLSRKNKYADIVWVLGATTAVDTQTTDDLRDAGINYGISVLILDWQTNELPLLAVALAMGGETVEEFLKEKLKPTDFDSAISALNTVKSNHLFSHLAEKIKAELDAPAIAISWARKANTKWLIQGFSSQKYARIKFKQPLAPIDASAVKVLPRSSLMQQITPYLIGLPDDKLVFILGGEGYGKSWVIVQSWLAVDYKPLFILFTADELPAVGQINDELLITKIITQTDDQNTEINIKRWKRRFEYWQNCGNFKSPNLIVVIDGINQSLNKDWG